MNRSDATRNTANAPHYDWGQACDGWHLVRTDELNVIEERMPPGAHEVPHYHERSRQFFYVLHGTLTMVVDGKPIGVEARSGIEITPGTTHQARNGSGDDVRFLVVSQPPSHGDRVEERLPAGTTVVRECRKEDVPLVHQFQERWAAEQITHGFHAAALDVLDRSLGPYFLVAEENGNTVGFVSGTARVSEGLAVIPSGLSYLEVGDLYVAPGYRGRGVGGKLLEAVLAKAKAAGLTKAMVYSASKDIHRILDFYGDHGFASWFVQMYREF